MKKSLIIALFLAIYCQKLECAAYASDCSAHTYASEPEKIYQGDNFSVWDFSAMASAQAGVDCGLHALKNSIALYNYYKGNINETTLKQQLKESTVGTLTIASCRADIGQAGLLSSEELYKLAARLHHPYNIPLLQHELLILDNLPDAQHIRTEEQNYQLANIIDRLQNKEPFVHALVLGNMNEGDTHSGHWVAAVFQQTASGERFLSIANSLGYTNRLYDQESKQANETFDKEIALQFNNFLAELARNPGWNSLRLQGIRSLISNIRTGIQDHHYESALIDIHNAINKAALHKLIQNPAFKDIKEQLIERLFEIPTATLGRQYAELKQYLINFLISDMPIHWNPPQTNHPAQDQSLVIASGIRSTRQDAEYLTREEQASLALAMQLEQEELQRQAQASRPAISTREIRALLGTIRNNIRNLHYRSALINIHNAINKAITQKLFNDPAFEPTRRQLIEILQEIPSLQGLGSGYFELQQYLLDFLTSYETMSWNPPQTGHREQEQSSR